jgi:RHS repeat-associated protein
VRGSDWGGGVGGILYTLRSGTASFTHYNHRGDVTAKTSVTGSLTYQSTYEAFGKRTAEVGSTPDREKSNTKPEDLAGYANEGFRFRDLETGVFLTRDPAGFVDGPNLYTYVVQNPWTSFDPEGLAKKKKELEEHSQEQERETVELEQERKLVEQELKKAHSTVNSENLERMSPVIDYWENRLEGIDHQIQQTEKATREANAALIHFALADYDQNGELSESEANHFNSMQSGIEHVGVEKTRNGKEYKSRGSTVRTREIRRVTNPKHNKNSTNPEPKNAEELWQKSVPDTNGRRWAKDADGNVHRFSKESNGESHWNGSTSTPVDPINVRDIPNEILKALKVKPKGMK